MNKERSNIQEYLLEKVGECVAGIQFLKWMFGIFVIIIIFLFSLVFQIKTNVKHIASKGRVPASKESPLSSSNRIPASNMNMEIEYE